MTARTAVRRLMRRVRRPHPVNARMASELERLRVQPFDGPPLDYVPIADGEPDDDEEPLRPGWTWRDALLVGWLIAALGLGLWMGLR